MNFLKISALAGCLMFGAAGMALAQPSADPSAPGNPAVASPNDIHSGPLAKGRNSFTKDEAKGRIEKAGYKHVTDLDLDSDGLWQASAERHGESVHVALDYKGDVATE